MDSFPEAVFDNITLIASQICQTPVALMSLIDKDRLWFKSKVGLEIEQIDRENSFCSHTLCHTDAIFEVPNTKEDPRFANNALVVNPPHVAFYAAAPLINSAGHRLGTLCVIDQKPRALNENQRQVLRALADQVMALLDARKSEKTAKKAILDSIPQITFAANTNGQVYEYNQTWYDYIGDGVSRKGEGRGQNSHIIHPEDNEHSRIEWEHCISTGKPYEVSHRLRKHDGTYRWHICRAIPIRNENGTIDSWFGTTTDIHDQRTNAEHTQTWLGQMLSLLPKPLFLIDFDSKKISSGNKAAEEMLQGNFSGFTEERSRGTNVEILDVHGKPLPLHLFPSNRVLAGEDLHGDEFILNVNGRHYHLESYSATLPMVPNQARAAILLLNDITDLKATEVSLSVARDSAESANLAKSQFLANMSHEIRTPLGAIMGFSDLMKTPMLSQADIDNYVSVIDRNSQHLLRVVDDILDLSKVEAGMMVIEKIEFSLLELITDVSSLMQFKAQEKGIGFQLSFESEIPEVVITDPTRLRQILSNILGNGIKFTDKGQVMLIISCEQNLLQFTIQDTGIGISDEQAERLFKPFQQADASTTRKFGGTGLGLALTKKLTQAMGGDIELLRSFVGHGTAFKATIQVELPKTVNFVKPNHLPGDKAMAAKTTDPNALLGMDILLIEDSPDNQVLIRHMLKRAGAAVDFASDGLEGVDKALAKNYNIVLCDLQMPRMDGYQAVHELRSRKYATPIVALTAHAMKEEYKKAMSSGFSDYLTKPVHQQTLIATLAKYRS